jgi:acyl-CoA thioesterase-1
MARRLFNVGIAALLGAAVMAPDGPAVAANGPVRLLALGDSLTAGYGLGEGQGFVPQLEKALRAKGYDVTVINAGVSGDTTAGGLSRLDWALGDKPDAALVELGANDMLRGLDPAAARANLDAILTKLKERNIPTLLAGIYASASYGRAYTERFDAIYPELAAKHGVPLYPFFLDGVATDAAMNQGDGIHPNAAGVKVIVERILPYVTRLLDNRARTGG